MPDTSSKSDITLWPSHFQPPEDDGRDCVGAAWGKPEKAETIDEIHQRLGQWPPGRYEMRVCSKCGTKASYYIVYDDKTIGYLCRYCYNHKKAGVLTSEDYYEREVMKTYKFTLYNSKKNKHLHRQIDLASEIYNHCVALHRRYYRMYKKRIHVYALQKHLTKLKKLPKYSHWYNLNSQAIQDIAERIDRGYKLTKEFLRWKPL